MKKFLLFLAGILIIVSIANAQTREITLAWDSVTSASGYKLYTFTPDFSYLVASNSELNTQITLSIPDTEKVYAFATSYSGTRESNPSPILVIKWDGTEFKTGIKPAIYKNSQGAVMQHVSGGLTVGP